MIMFCGLWHGSNRMLAHQQVVIFFELPCELAKQMRPLRRRLFFIIASRVEPVRLRSLVCSVKPSKLTRQFGYAVLMVQEQPVPLPSEPSVEGGVDVADHASSDARVALGERLDCDTRYWGVAMSQPRLILTLQVFEMVVSAIVDGLATQP